jgi:predicted patatin/cPLA2 family phospholipase
MPNLYDELTVHRQNKNDKRIFGLVLQGGGMRGVYSAGAFAPLAAYGFQDTFEHVIGSSAGAINGAYLMGGMAESYKVYEDELTNKNFVNLARRDKKVDVDYAIDVALHQKNPVNIERLRRAHTTLHVVMTNARTGKKEVISDHHKFLEIYEELRATAALPFLYDKKIKIRDTEYIDGGVSDLLPVDVAVQLGCTDIMVVMTQQVSSFRFDRRHTRLVNHLIRRFAKKTSTAAVRKILPTNEKVLKANLRLLRHPAKKIRIYLLEPSDEQILVSLATTDKPKVAALATLGVRDMDAFLHQPL